MKTSEFRRRINARWIGFDPDDMKTAHIANGLFLEIMHVQHTAEDVNRLAVIAGKRGPVKGHENDKLRGTISALQGLGDVELSLVRSHINQHLNADSAVFDRQINVGCAYSAATARLVVDDHHNDGWSGNFIAKLLTIDYGSGSSPLLAKIQDALTDETDPLSTMLTPFLASESAPFAHTYDDLEESHFIDLLLQIDEMRDVRRSLDTFAAYYPGYLSKQRFTRLFVILSSAALLRYLIARARSISQNPTLPFFVDASPKLGTRIRFASQLAYIRCIVELTEFYERLVQKFLYERAVELGGSDDVSFSAIQYAVGDVTDQLREELLKDARKHYVMDVHMTEAGELMRDAAHHIVDHLFEKQGVFIGDFFRTVGIRAGIIVPRGSYPRKHFSLQPDTLTALTMACIPPDELPMTIREFADTLWQRFGFLIGGGGADIDILHDAAVRDINEDDLYSNYQHFTHTMVTLGLAQQRSDGLVLVHPLRR
jgi:hypothetical protein